MESHEVHVYIRFNTRQFSHAIIGDSHKAKLICLHTDVQGFEPAFKQCFSALFCDYKLKLTSFLTCIALLH